MTLLPFICEAFEDIISTNEFSSDMYLKLKAQCLDGMSVLIVVTGDWVEIPTEAVAINEILCV